MAIVLFLLHMDLFTFDYNSFRDDDIIEDEILLPDDEEEEEEVPIDVMEWTETSVPEDTIPTLSLPSPPTPTFLPLPPLPSLPNISVTPPTLEEEEEEEIIRVHEAISARRRPRSEKSSTPTRVQRACAPRDLAEPRQRLRKTLPDNDEHTVAGILAHDVYKRFLVRWEERGTPKSWEPMRNFADWDATGKAININSVALQYARVHNLPYFD